MSDANRTPGQPSTGVLTTQHGASSPAAPLLDAETQAVIDAIEAGVAPPGAAQPAPAAPPAKTPSQKRAARKPAQSGIDENFDANTARGGLADAIASGAGATEVARRAAAVNPFGQAAAAVAGKYIDEADAAAQLTNKYAFVLQRNAYLEKDTGLLIEPAALNAYEAHRMPVVGAKVDQATGKISGGKRLIATTVINESSFKKTAHDLGYHPSRPWIYQSRDGLTRVNSYKAPDYELLEPTDAERQMWSDYLHHLFPDLETNAGANVILDSLAWLVANPGGRLRYKTIFVGSRKGSGKSLLLNVIPALLVGPRNHREVGRSETAGRFIDYLIGHRVVCEDEVFEGDLIEAEERFNMRAAWLTSDSITGDLKGIKGVSIENVITFFAISNYPDKCGFIPEDDRRVLLVQTSAGELAERLKVDFIEGVLRSPRGPGVIASLLAARDISKFDPHRRPIMTAAKRIARITQQLTELQTEIIAAFQDGDAPFNKDFAPASDVRDCLKQRGFREHSIPGDTKLGQQIRKAFEIVGLKCVRMDTQAPGIGSDRGRRLWAWRNPDRWEKAIKTDIQAYTHSSAYTASAEAVMGLKAEGRHDQADRVNKLIEEGREADRAARQLLNTQRAAPKKSPERKEE